MGRKAKTHEQFLSEVKSLVGSEYEILGKYITASVKIPVKHHVCGNQYEVRPKDLLKGVRCSKCYGNSKKTTILFKEEVKELVGDEYVVLSEYINDKTKLLMAHTTCGFEYKVKPNWFLGGNRCPYCAGVLKKDNKTFKEEVKALEGDNYQVLSEYINSKTKLTIKHNICGNEYEVKPTAFLMGSRCPMCNVSKGERLISDFLSNHKIEYTPEFKDASCKDKRVLPFDFAITEGAILIALIEYDGEQHYKAVKSWGGEPLFLDRQRKDAIKTKFCADKGIPLIRIPYWDYDSIEEILTEKLLPLVKDVEIDTAI